MFGRIFHENGMKLWFQFYYHDIRYKAREKPPLWEASERQFLRLRHAGQWTDQDEHISDHVDDRPPVFVWRSFGGMQWRDVIAFLYTWFLKCCYAVATDSGQNYWKYRVLIWMGFKRPRVRISALGPKVERTWANRSCSLNFFCSFKFILSWNNLLYF